MASSITADEIREQFSRATSAMYQQEVPQYGTLLELVTDVNLAVLENNPQLHEKMVSINELVRLSVGRHGAIRAGTAQEPVTLRRMLTIVGVYLVGYYDPSQAEVSVHSTVFRPIDDASLARNPFRVLTSLLHLEPIENEILRQKAVEILRQRDIFIPCCRQLLEKSEQQGGFNETQAQEFVQEALRTSHWHQPVAVNKETYRVLHNERRLITDMVRFPGCHINHLIPRTLDIGWVRPVMPECGIEPKVLIEGPPRHEVPILLHQTSFKTLEETVLFAGQEQGTYAARFGEIEQRGVTLMPKRRQPCDNLLRSTGTGRDNLTHQMHLQETLHTFPDNEFLMHQQGLGWFRYRLTPSSEAHRQAVHPGDDPQSLIERG